MTSFTGITNNPRYQQDDTAVDPSLDEPRMHAADDDVPNLQGVQKDVNHGLGEDPAQDPPDDQEPPNGPLLP